MKYRLIRLEEFDAYTNMALDEIILERVIQGKALPTIRFFTWNPSSVSIGNFQGAEQEVNIPVCKNNGISVVRRITGGGSVYHDRNGEITYSVIAPEEWFPKDIVKSYEVICGWIVNALNELGINAEFKPINDVHINGRKVSGSAQTRRKGVLLQHGTVLYDANEEKIALLLKGRADKYDERLTKSIKKRITSVKENCDASRGELAKALEKAFGNGKEIAYSGYETQELNEAKKLAKEKYLKEDWNYKR